MQIDAATMDNSMRVSKKIKYRTTIWSINFTSGYLHEEIKNTDLKSYTDSSVHYNIIYSSHDVEAT